jgi:hypothetical protein
MGWAEGDTVSFVPMECRWNVLLKKERGEEGMQHETCDQDGIL